MDWKITNSAIIGAPQSKVIFLLFLRILLLFTFSQDHAAAADPLPSGVPSPIGPDGKYTHSIRFTTEAYRREALKRLITEANLVAKQLQLPEELPITESNIVAAFVSPFGYAYAKGAIGTVTTKNYAYYVSNGNKFCFLESSHQEVLCRQFEASSSYTFCAVRSSSRI